MSCEDPDCPACVLEKAVAKLKDQGCDPDMLIGMFFLTLNEVFSSQYEIQDVSTIIEEQTLH